MNWDDIKKKRVEGIVEVLNEYLLDKIPLNEVAKKYLATEQEILEFMHLKGYEINKNTNTFKKVDYKVVIDPSKIEMNNYLIREFDTLIDMIKWYKSIANREKNNIKINLPEADIKRTTIRINESVWEDFDKFVDSHSEYDKHTLMSQALVEFMNKYSI